MRFVRIILISTAVLVVSFAGCRKEEPLPQPPDTLAVSNVIAAITSVFAPSGDFLRLNVQNMRVAEFYQAIKSASPLATLWMPGEHDWLLLGIKSGVTNSLSAAMDAFAALDTRLPFPKMFCAYVGTVGETLPAFKELNFDAIVAPQNFVTKEIPQLRWLKTGDVDEDIRASVMSEIRSMQFVRREVIKGNMLAAAAKDRKGETAAIDVWSKAALRNSEDSFLAERLERLERNASGFRHLGKVLPAMKCYETMMRIKPTSVNVHNFGMCLKKIGKLDLAEKVLKRAKEFEKAESSAK